MNAVPWWYIQIVLCGVIICMFVYNQFNFINKYLLIQIEINIYIHQNIHKKHFKFKFKLC